MPDETIIYLKRTGLWGMTLGALGIANLGVWFLLVDTRHLAAMEDPGILHGIGLLFTALFAVLGMAGIWKLRQSPIGLILNHEGLDDRSSGVGAGFVPWSDVTGVETNEVDRQKFILIQVQDPEPYLNRGSGFTRSIMAKNLNEKGTPVAIPVSTLRAYPDELWSMINAYFEAHGDGSSPGS